ncbi:PTS fructose transporter subunit IIB [Oceanobacillus sp. Castelsardo]|uniref:PTS fructose transporter subunit IIB n=1 Tax=Oceanobacillus sp. Castelsardo TaxID=1851204 RepID=UPI000AF5E3D0|nr:PTS fructose transporter subunit IIB [Oceanobacillus sp. Castelsardo]
MIKILSVCGSGVVTSSMVANKLVELFEEKGIEAEAVESNPSEMENYISRDKYDLIAYASPIPDNFGLPAFSAMGLITGMGEEEFMEEALNALRKSGKIE